MVVISRPTAWSPPALAGASQHPLLGGHVHDPDTPGRHLRQTPTGPRLLPWLADHAVAGVPVLPGTAAVEMMLAAAAPAYGTEHVAASDVHVQSPLILDPEPQVTTRLVRDSDSAHVEIVTASGDGVTVHARGTVRPLPEHERPVPLTHADLAPENWRDYGVAALHHTFRDKHNVFHRPPPRRGQSPSVGGGNPADQRVRPERGLTPTLLRGAPADPSRTLRPVRSGRRGGLLVRREGCGAGLSR
ncbi:hypothetical protein ACFQ6V_22390 [Streptomyces roseifaciens]